MKNRKNRWVLVLCAAILLALTLYLYWHRSKDNAVPSVVTTQKTEETHGQRELTPNTTDPIAPQTPSTAAPEAAAPIAGNATQDVEEITEALNFLEKIEEDSVADANISTSDTGTDSPAALTQAELFQLVREGVAYYDSLLESGSVDFYLQTSSVDYPGAPRMPDGTYEGTFQFSGNRIRAEVTRNATQYDEQFGGFQLSDTRQFAYDGETFENLEETQRGQRLTRSSEVVADPSIDPRAWGWGSEDGKRGLADVIDRLENPYIEQIDSDGIEVYHVKGTLQRIVEVELWLNAEESYRPIRHTFFTTNNNDTTTYVARDYTYQEVAPDLWFPKSSTEVVTLTHLQTGSQTDLQTRTMQFSNLRINEPIPSRKFSIEVPPGTTVFDARTRETFKTEAH